MWDEASRCPTPTLVAVERSVEMYGWVVTHTRSYVSFTLSHIRVHTMVAVFRTPLPVLLETAFMGFVIVMETLAPLPILDALLAILRPFTTVLSPLPILEAIECVGATAEVDFRTPLPILPETAFMGLVIVMGTLTPLPILNALQAILRPCDMEERVPPPTLMAPERSGEMRVGPVTHTLTYVSLILSHIRVHAVMAAFRIPIPILPETALMGLVIVMEAFLAPLPILYALLAILRTFTAFLSPLPILEV